MADPFTEYQKVLAERGLGSVFQEEGPAMAPGAKTVSERKRLQKKFSEGNYPEKLMKAAFIRNLDKDAESKTIPSSGIEAALDEVRRAGFNSGLYGPKESLSFLEKKAQQESRNSDAARIEAMPEDSSVFQSPMDSISAQIERARLNPLVGSSRPDTQSIIADNERDAAAEEFRADEAESFDDTSLTIAEGDKISEDTFKAAMDGFLGSSRGASPDKREKTLAEYKKEFAAATGVDVSGKVDKSQALMAMGLALMQNRAGKGFNVGKLLNAVGQAGEKALPALEKAKAEAKKAGLAAGQYALQSRNSDQAKDEANVEKGRQRSAFYIVPKGKGVSGFLANIDQGQLENLNPFELDALMSNESFQETFDVVPGNTWSGIVEEAMKTKEAQALYLTKNPNTISLIPGVESDLFTIKTFDADPNVAGSEGRSARLSGNGQEQYKALAAAAQDLQRAKVKFMDGFGLAESTSAFRFTLDKVDSLAGAFGINVDGVANNTEKLKLFLNKLKAQNAKEILGEAGKTISDADRALVESIVGNVSVLESPDLLAEKMSQLYNDVIVKKERQIIAALTTLDRYSGRKIASRLGGSGKLNAEDQAELDAALNAIGEQNG